MITTEHDNLAADLSILGKKASLSLTARTRVRDRLFKKIGQVDLIDAIQTKTEIDGLVMPMQQLLSIFKPTRVSFSWGATTAIGLAVMILTFATGAFAQNAEPGSGLFYTVRQAIENTQIALTPNPTAKAKLKLAIATDRLATIQSADPKNLEAVLNESKKAVTEAQTAVAALSKSPSGDDLSAKLASIIGSQNTILTTIVQANPDNDAIKQSALAMRDELNKLLPPVITKPADDKDTAVVVVTPVPTDLTKPGDITLSGEMGTFAARPVLLVGGTRYFLDGAAINIIQFAGSDNVTVSGHLDPSTSTIQLTKLTIDSKLVWETPDKNNNNLPGVEGSQN